MPLRLLLDENISYVVADQLRIHRPEIEVESVFQWREGAFKSKKDRELLLAAATERLTLITYDLKTIPPLVDRFTEEGEHHAGIIFVDELTVSSGNFGALLRAIIEFWEDDQVSDWQDQVGFLRKPKQ